MKSKNFRDFDEFSASVRDVDAVMMLQNPSRRRWTISQVNVDGIDVQLGQLGSGNIVEGQSWSSGTLLYLPLSHRVSYSANGIDFGQNQFMALEPSCEFCLRTKFAHDWCSIFVPTENPIGDGDPPEPSLAPPISEVGRCRVTLADRQLAASAYSIVKEVIIASANSSRFETSPAAKSAGVELRKVVPLVLGEMQPVESNRPGRRNIPRSQIIYSCRELVRERNGRPIRVDELAATAGVSERTLRLAFHEWFGLGPARYLQLRQLHQVYWTLRRMGPEVGRVGDVLADFGVWEFGRFASRYRRLFGELPSQTRRRMGSVLSPTRF